MQLNPSYLYRNKMDVYSELGAWTTERYRNVYQRNFKVYRGVNNRLDFQVRNGDQKPQPMTGYNVVFNLFARESDMLVVNRTCEVQSLATGKFFVTLTEADMMNLDNGFYTFSLHAVDAGGNKTPLYGDSQYGATGNLDVVGKTYPEPIDSTQVTNFLTVQNYSPPATYRFSDVLDAKPQFNSNTALHTFALYGKNFVGTATVQGSLDPFNAITNWIDLATVNFNSDNIKYQNIEGIWSYFRIKLDVTSGTLDKILYRY